MADYAFDRLTFLDNSCLVLETENLPMHVASLARYEVGSLATAEGGVDIDRIRSYVESRLHLIPRYRQRLAWSPIENHPVWIDDAHFNLHFHVRHTALPKPGDERQLKRLAARIMAGHLDRSRPLWEMWIVEGLEGGQFAVFTKIHHCMVDGVSSVDIMNVLMRPESSLEIEPPATFAPRPAPTALQLARESVARWARLPFEIAADVPGFVTALGDPRSDARARVRVVRDTLASAVRSYSPSRTPFNEPVGPHRRVDWTEIDLAAMKAVKNATGASLNDVVLATVTGAVRRFLERRRVPVEGLDFRVLAPVSMRTPGERGTLGNRVSAWLVPLPIAERDPLRVIAEIRETTARLKETKQAMGADTLLRVGEWTPSTLLDVASRMTSRKLPFNITVTNVPGPQTPLHLLDAKMVDGFGMIPLGDDVGLGIVLLSYLGKLSWGFTADWQQLPDLHDFVRDVEAAFAELHRAAAGRKKVA